jgi:Flp pilus assembly protein TadG
MRRSSRWIERARSIRATVDGDRGSAALEFIAVGLLLLVPLVYLVIALGAVQEQALGVEAGARHVARVVATSPDTRTAGDRADAVLRAVVEEYGLDRSQVAVSLACRPVGDECPAAGSTVVVEVRSRVALPFVPPILGLDRLISVPVQASAAQKVSRFGGSG